jgi:hypothetical protein
MTGIAVADVFASVKMLLAGEDSSAAGASLRVLDQ